MKTIKKIVRKMFSGRTRKHEYKIDISVDCARYSVLMTAP
jgi:hypothetical protein